jgi:hypothetical protein
LAAVLTYCPAFIVGDDEGGTMIRSMVAGATIAALACTSATAQPDKAQRLMRQLKAASGGAALDRPDAFHESGTIVRDGASGVYEYWGDLRTLRSAGNHTLSDATGGGGFDGQVAWSVDAAGKVSVDDSPKAVHGARLGTYLSIGGYFYPDRFPARFVYLGRQKQDGASFDVVAVTPQDADTADLWLDPKTHRLAQISVTADGVEGRGRVLRYQVVDGTWIGFDLTQTEGAHAQTQHLEHYVYGPVEPDRYAPPKP